MEGTMARQVLQQKETHTHRAYYSTRMDRKPHTWERKEAV